MAFDMGWNARSTSGYVTDDAHYGVPLLLEAFPHTYTNGDGQSVNGGYEGNSTATKLNYTTGNDVRLAGTNYVANAPADLRFKVDLSSGSAPGAGDYTIDGAWGWPEGCIVDFKVFDGTTSGTLLIDGTNGGAGYTLAGNHYIDAGLVERTATTTWNGVAVSKTFATTTVTVQLGPDGVSNLTMFTHFRLTLASAPAGIAVPVLMAQYRQRRS